MKRLLRHAGRGKSTSKKGERTNLKEPLVKSEHNISKYIVAYAALLGLIVGALAAPIPYQCHKGQN